MNPASKIFEKALMEGRKLLLENEAKMVCMEYGIPTTRFKLVRTEFEAVEAAEEIGYPVVLKIVSPDIIHKSDVGGVILNVKNSSDVRDAYKQILENVKRNDKDAKVIGILVQEMALPSTEIIIGAAKDPHFGHALMFGLGGVFTEVLKDVAFRIAPLTESEAREMITEIKAYPLLKGYRNVPPADIEAIVAILMNVSRLVLENTGIKELDLNPIMVYKKGAKAVDARIILE